MPKKLKEKRSKTKGKKGSKKRKGKRKKKVKKEKEVPEPPPLHVSNANVYTSVQITTITVNELQIMAMVSFWNSPGPHENVQQACGRGGGVRHFPEQGQEEASGVVVHDKGDDEPPA